MKNNCFTALSVTVALGAVNILAQPAPANFIDLVLKRLSGYGSGSNEMLISPESISKFCAVDKSPLAKRVLTEYGAIFAAANEVQLPGVCIFPDERAVREFRSKLKTKTAVIDEVEIELQEVAMNSLFLVADDAKTVGIKIIPLDGSIAAGRTYFDTVRIWYSRFDPALKYWIARGKIATDDEAALRALPLEKQMEKVIEWESRGLLFGTGHALSIFSSTAPPGTSQHLSLLAFDVARFPSEKLIAIFNSHGWFQTVKGDPQHFTYLGLSESDLPGRGLRSMYYDGIKYWLPNVSEGDPIIHLN